MLLVSVAAQTYQGFRLCISDQTEDSAIFSCPEFIAVSRLLELQGNQVAVQRHLPRRGIAEQRQFLFEQSAARYCLYLDDDLLLEPWVIEHTVQALQESGCGFAGRAPIGLSYCNEVRPEEQEIEFWDGPPEPEVIAPGGEKWQRYRLHNAANLLHVEKKLGIGPDEQRLYRVAWVGGCVLYDAEKLRSIGAFSFWEQLPEDHCGEDVLVQLKLAEKYGGCGVLPSGVYHQELVTTIPHRYINAPEYLSSAAAEDLSSKDQADSA